MKNICAKMTLEAVTFTIPEGYEKTYPSIFFQSGHFQPLVITKISYSGAKVNFLNLVR